jgi:GxxExxY protein
MNDINQLTGTIIGKAIEVHRILGPGLLESTYKNCLFYELQSSGLEVLKEYPVPLIYKEIHLDHGYRIDLLVENLVVVEIKTVDTFIDVHFAQILTYMKLGNRNIGLLINFNVCSLRNGGIKRFVI